MTCFANGIDHLIKYIKIKTKTKDLLNFNYSKSFILGNPKLQYNASEIDLKIDVKKSEVMSLNTCHPQKDY